MTYDFGSVDDVRRRTMQAVGSEDTGPEQVARLALEEMGVLYDEQVGFGRYTVDFVLEDGTVLQVMGCFWHACPRHGNDPETNRDYWSPKLVENVERDRRRRRELLTEYGAPYVFWVWEHDDIAERVASLCRSRGIV